MLRWLMETFIMGQDKDPFIRRVTIIMSVFSLVSMLLFWTTCKSDNPSPPPAPAASAEKSADAKLPQPSISEARRRGDLALVQKIVQESRRGTSPEERDRWWKENHD